LPILVNIRKIGEPSLFFKKVNLLTIIAHVCITGKSINPIILLYIIEII